MRASTLSAITVNQLRKRRALGHVRAPGGNALILALKQERHQTFGGSPQRQLFAVSGAQVSEFGGDEGGVGA